MYLDQLNKAINDAKDLDNTDFSNEDLISNILLPCVQLKANGTMFHFPLITRIADRFVQFMEVIEAIDKEVLAIAEAFHTIIKIVISNQIKEGGDSQGDALVNELNGACMRYFDKIKTSK